MTGGFRTDNEELAGRAGAFAEFAERAGRIVADLDGELSVHGACWGSDAAGAAFAGCHAGPADAALRAVGRLPGGLRDVGARLSATAARYDESEQAGQHAVGGAGNGLG